MAIPATPDGWEHLIEQALARTVKGAAALASSQVEVWFKRTKEVLWIYAGDKAVALEDADRDVILRICRAMPVRPRTDAQAERSRAPVWHPRSSDAFEMAFSNAPLRSATLRAARRAARLETPDLGRFLAEEVTAARNAGR